METPASLFSLLLLLLAATAAACRPGVDHSNCAAYSMSSFFFLEGVLVLVCSGRKQARQRCDELTPPKKRRELETHVASALERTLVLVLVCNYRGAWVIKD